MKQGEYFKINSVEELKQVYRMYEDRWFYSLEDEIYVFSNHDCRYVLYSTFGIYLGKYIISTHTEIKSPVNNINNLNKFI